MSITPSHTFFSSIWDFEHFLNFSLSKSDFMQKVKLNSSFHVLGSAQNSIEINSRGENIHDSPTTLYYVEVPPYSLFVTPQNQTTG